jgi:hypothetical protein
MATAAAIAIQIVAPMRVDKYALRRVCAFCSTELPGSNPNGKQTSHGICDPPCGPAVAMGWSAAHANAKAEVAQ